MGKELKKKQKNNIWIENINKETEIIKRNQIETLELKSTIAKMKFIRRVKSRLE